MGNKRSKIYIDTDENGNSTILLPDSTSQKLYETEYCANNFDECLVEQKLYEAEYCAKNFDECFVTHKLENGKLSKYSRSKVPIRVYKKTKEPSARYKDHISILTTLIILPNTEVYTDIYDYFGSRSSQVTEGRAASAYVYSQILFNSRIRKNNKFKGKHNIPTDRSVSYYDNSFVYKNGQMVQPKKEFYSLEHDLYDKKHGAYKKKYGIHFNFYKNKASYE